MTSPAFVTTCPSLTSGISHLCTTPATTAAPAALPRTARRPSRPRFCMSASRKFIVGGNWKCNMNKATIKDLVAAFNNGPKLDADHVEVVVAPPAVYLDTTRAQLREDFATSAQNAWVSKGGAFTGELDATMVKDVGADWVILGHSERRHTSILREDDDTIATKAKYALESGLKVMYCIGETLEQREAGDSVAVCEKQLAALAKTISDWSAVVIAYEPVWAIGTGKVATPDQAEEVHSAVRSWLGKNVSDKVAQETRIMYGGSVSPKNCQDLAKKSNIDGFLVGGASLQPSFMEIVESYKTALAGAV